MKPYKCPVCEGTGNVVKGFYVDDPKRTKCRACIQGVVYGSDSEPASVPVPIPYPQPYPVPYPVYPPAQPITPYQPWRPWIWYGPTDGFRYTVTSTGTSTVNPEAVTINGLSDGANLSAPLDTTFTVSS